MRHAESSVLLVQRILRRGFPFTVALFATLSCSSTTVQREQTQLTTPQNWQVDHDTGIQAVKQDEPTQQYKHLRKHKVRRVHLPPGHLPPPGWCRIWLPGTPPGHQPKPGRCKRLEAQIPPGGWLLYRPDKSRNIVRIF